MFSAALALAASSKSEKIDSFTVVWIPVEDIKRKGLSIVESDGDTVITDLVKTHRDLSGITYGKLGNTAELILEQLTSNNHVKRFTRAELKKALAEAYLDDKICLNKCNPNFIVELQKFKPKTN